MDFVIRTNGFFRLQRGSISEENPLQLVNSRGRTELGQGGSPKKTKSCKKLQTRTAVSYKDFFIVSATAGLVTFVILLYVLGEGTQTGVGQGRGESRLGKSHTI